MPSALSGSSPLTRGKLIREKYPEGALVAHPRSRGENERQSIGGSQAHGSSPLTRGKLLQEDGLLAVHGLIPAHAGKTRLLVPGAWSVEAHPRSRGENRLVYWPTRQVMGSSPLTRGKHARNARGMTIPRLIPAHAGKTQRHDWYDQRMGAHPRSRGENIADSLGIPLRHGSSPLTRGKLDPLTQPS